VTVSAIKFVCANINLLTYTLPSAAGCDVRWLTTHDDEQSVHGRCHYVMTCYISTAL